MPSGSETVLFAFQCITVLSAVGVALLPHVLHAAVALLFTLVGVAVMFLFAAADFVAAAQVMIYAGGVTMLVLFAIMLTHFIYKAKLKDQGMRLLVPGIVAFGVFTLVYRGLIDLGRWIPQNAPEKFAEFSSSPKTAAIGDALLGNYLLAFEAVTILLLGALVGAVWLARPEQ